jgi:5-formyltetrahydrofolate cyclo-ligase
VIKRELRVETQRIRDSISQEEKITLDNMIAQNLYSWEVYQNVRYIFCYVSFRSEVNTFPLLIHSLNHGKIVSVPRINIKTKIMRAYIINDISNHLKPGNYGILEPDPECVEADYSKISLIITPGVAFTQRGDRLGYGGGYYDRFLHEHSITPICAPTYSRLILDFLPVKENDVPVDYLITESGVIRTQRS